TQHPFAAHIIGDRVEVAFWELTAMYDYSRTTPYPDYGAEISAARPAVLGQVLGLLGFAFLFTAGVAVIVRTLGPLSFLISVIGPLPTRSALTFARDRAPLNLGLRYALATFEGLPLRLTLEP